MSRNKSAKTLLFGDLADIIREEIDKKIIEDIKRMEDPLADLKKLVKKAKRKYKNEPL